MVSEISRCLSNCDMFCTHTLRIIYVRANLTWHEDMTSSIPSMVKWSKEKISRAD